MDRNDPPIIEVIEEQSTTGDNIASVGTASNDQVYYISPNLQF